jgi:hypothetical protein
MKKPRMLTVIRWEFVRGQERLTCEVDREVGTGPNSGRFAVVSLPYERLQRATVEVFQSATSALRRHAMLAADLRATGWKLVAYTS